MASPATGLKPCVITVKLFSGARTALPEGTEVLLTLRNGNQEVVHLPNNGFFKVPAINVGSLPFFNNFGDNYTVIASADDYEQAGFTPVKVNPLAPATVNLMLLRKDAEFNFRNARWDLLKSNYPSYAGLLAAGAADDAAAQDRYSQLMENRPGVLACYFNLLAAMAQIHLPEGSPVGYVRELIWDGTMQRDRFFAWAEPALVDQVAQAAAQGAFSPEPGTAAFHAGATRSWKQVQFGEANVQLTFHENDRKTVGGIDCVMVEPDVDYYRDPLAHGILEVVTNKITHSLSDPKQVYVLRWIAGCRAGQPNFEPPYTLE